MLVLNLRVILLVVSGAFLALAGSACAHTVPSMTMEADFNADGSYALRVNVDPRLFMAAEPSTLPPVPASWYRDQTPEQVAATHEKAREYLAACLLLIFDGRKGPLPQCEFQAIDGADNTPLDPETEEVHLLATARGPVPAGARLFRVSFGKEANTNLVLLITQEGKTVPRADAVLPGEESKEVAIRAENAAPVAAKPAPPVESINHVWLILVIGVTLIAILIGWRLLVRYRHHHKFHRKPRSM